MNEYDIAILLETFVDSVPESLFPNHTVFSCPGVKLTQSTHGRLCGGVAVLVRNCLASKVERIDLEADNIVAVKLHNSLLDLNNDCILLGVYLPPENSQYYSETDIYNGVLLLEYCLLEIHRLYGDLPIIIGGDLNARSGNLNSDMLRDIVADTCFMTESGSDIVTNTNSGNERASKDLVVNNFGKYLLLMCTNFGLSIINGLMCSSFSSDFTYVVSNGCSVIDLFVVSNTLLGHCQYFIVNHMVEFKHAAIALDFSCPPTFIHKNTKLENFSFSKFKWDNSKRAIFLQKMSSERTKETLDASISTIDTDINEALKTFNDALFYAGQCMKKNIHVYYEKKHAWFDWECAEFRKVLRKLLRKFARSNKVSDRIAYAEKRKEYKKLLENKKNSYKDKILTDLQSYVDDPCKFWAVIQSTRTRNQQRVNISKDDWFNHFSDIFNASESEHNKVGEEENDDVVNESLDCPIQEVEIEAALKGLKNNKAAGPDCLIGEFYKNAVKEIMPFLVKFFNHIFDRGIFPTDWCLAILQPLHKKGDLNVPDNYRGISLLNTCSKIYTSILNRRINSWINENNIIGEEQAGFREEHSTMDHIFTLMATIQKQLVRHRKLYVSFIDFRKAFDSISRQKLWLILRKNGISSKMLQAIKSIYTVVKAKVRVGGEYTESFLCPRGLKQGEICSPVIFSLLINELTKDILEKGKHGVQLSPELIHLLILLFADDVALMADTVAGLQKQLDILHTTCLNLDLTVNLDKSNIVVFRNGGHLALREQWNFGNVPLSVVNCYKYLGVYLTTKLSFSRTLDDLAAKAKKGVITILQSLWSLGDHSPQVFFKLFDCQVLPILTYGAEIWGLSVNLESLERVHLFALKRFLGVHPRTPRHLLYGDTGRYPLSVTIQVKCVKFWFRLLRLQNNRLSKKAYKMLLFLQSANYVTWLDGIRNSLFMQGFGIVWESQGVGDEKAFLNCYKQSLIDCYGQTWHAALGSHDFYKFYSSIRQSIDLHPYIFQIRNFHLRRLYARFRFGMTELKGSSLDFKDIAMSERKKCPFCLNTMESEYHFVMICPKYNVVRQKFIPAKFTRFPSTNRFFILMASTSPYLMNRLCSFLNEAFKLRQNNLL